MTRPLYGLKIAKRPVRAKALIINAFALTGRIVFGGFLPQGVALGYVLLPLRGVLLRLLTHPPPTNSPILIFSTFDTLSTYIPDYSCRLFQQRINEGLCCCLRRTWRIGIDDVEVLVDKYEAWNVEYRPFRVQLWVDAVVLFQFLGVRIEIV